MRDFNPLQTGGHSKVPSDAKEVSVNLLASREGMHCLRNGHEQALRKICLEGIEKITDRERKEPKKAVHENKKATSKHGTH